MSDDKVNYEASILSFGMFIVASFVFSSALYTSNKWDSLAYFWLVFGGNLTVGFSVLLYFLVWHAKVESGQMKDTWQFKFLTFMTSEHNIPDKINSCEIAGMLGKAILVLILRSVGFIAGSIFCFFIAKKVSFKTLRESDYEHWPTFYGYRVWPITLVALGFVFWGFWELALRMWSLDHSFLTSFQELPSWMNFWYLLLVVLFFSLGFYGNKYRKTEDWKENKKAIKESFQVLLGKICVSKETGVPEKSKDEESIMLTSTEDDERGFLGSSERKK